MSTHRHGWTSAALVAAALGLAAACGTAAPGAASDGGAAPPLDAGASLVEAGVEASLPGFGGGTFEAGTPGVVQPTGPVTDFPAPIFDGNAPPNAPTLFGPPRRTTPPSAAAR